MQRELIGEGQNHHVWRSLFHPNIVLKTPKPHISRLTRYIRPSRALLADFLNLHPDLPSETNLAVPYTRLIQFGHNYTIIQRYIEEDHSIPDVLSSLENQKLHYHALKYRSNPTNFITHQGYIYWVDTNYGPINYLLVRSGLLTPTQYQSLKLKLKPKKSL